MHAGVDVDTNYYINPNAESGYEELPAEVGETADSILTLLQNGGVPERKDYGVRSGVSWAAWGKLGSIAASTPSASICGSDAIRPFTSWTPA